MGKAGNTLIGVLTTTGAVAIFAALLAGETSAPPKPEVQRDHH